MTALRASARGGGDITVVMFTDYQCPACRNADIAMRAALAADGNIRVVYKDWPIFGPRSERAAQVALAAARQGIYPQVHHSLMRATQLDDEQLRSAVEAAGGDWQQVLTDLRDHGPAIRVQLVENARQAFRLGFKGTPGYLVGPVRVRGAMSKSEFVRTFAEVRQRRRLSGTR